MLIVKEAAAATLLIGPFVDIEDGVTPETGVTLGAADAAVLMKHDGAGFVDIAARTWTHVANGLYNLTLTAEDTGTHGRLTVFIRDDNLCLPVRADFTVMDAISYEAILRMQDRMWVDVREVNGADATTALAAAAATGAAAALGTYDPPTKDELDAGLAAVPAAVAATDVDSTGTEAVTIAKALELILAATVGVCAYDADTGSWVLKGRDGSTTVLTGTVTDEGDRTASVIA